MLAAEDTQEENRVPIWGTKAHGCQNLVRVQDEAVK